MNSALDVIRFSEQEIKGAHIIRYTDYYHPCNFNETIKAALCNLDFIYSGVSDEEMSKLVFRFRKFYKNPQRTTRTISIYIEK